MKTAEGDDKERLPRRRSRTHVRSEATREKSLTQAGRHGSSFVHRKCATTARVLLREGAMHAGLHGDVSTSTRPLQPQSANIPPSAAAEDYL